MKPGPQKWATNSTYASGVDAGNQNKYEPSSGRVSDGFERAKKLATGWENMVRWRLAERLDYLSQARMKNWFIKNIIGAVPWVAGSHLATPCSRMINGELFVHLEVIDGAADYVVYSRGGEVFSIAGSSRPAGAVPQQMASDGSGNACIALSGVANGFYYATAAAPLTWVVRAGTAGMTGIAAAYDSVNSRWLFYDGAGGAGDILYSPTLGGAPAVAASPGYTATSNVALVANNHGAGKLYPQDAGNDIKLCATGAGSWYRSVGNAIGTWSALTPAPFAPTLAEKECLDYSAWGSRWGAIVTNGPTTGANNLTFAYSDDNGDNWVELNDPFGWVARGAGAYSFSPDSADLVCDGYGHWVAAFTLNTGGSETWESWASGDNGLTWSRVYFPASAVAASTFDDHVALWYGDGAFWEVHSGFIGAAAVLDIFSSLRTGE